MLVPRRMSSVMDSQLISTVWVMPREWHQAYKNSAATVPIGPHDSLTWSGLRNVG